MDSFNAALFKISSRMKMHPFVPTTNCTRAKFNPLGPLQTQKDFVFFFLSREKKRKGRSSQTRNEALWDLIGLGNREREK